MTTTPAYRRSRWPTLIGECDGFSRVFYTFSPEVLATVGYLDSDALPFGGHSHLDFTTRCCRAGFSREQALWDVDGAPTYVSMWDREEYASVTDWRSPKIVQYFRLP